MTDAISRLRQIPGLAVEVWLTRHAPNPSEQPLTHQRRANPPAPVPLAPIDALRADGHGLLAELTQAVRAVWEDNPGVPLSNPATWSGECDWLIGHRDMWESDPFLCELVTGAVEVVWTGLRHVARIPEPPRLACMVPGCPGVIEGLDDQAGGWLWPDVCSENHRVDRHAIARMWSELALIPASEVAERMGVADRTVRRWKRAGIIAPHVVRRGVPLFRLADVRERVTALHVA